VTARSGYPETPPQTVGYYRRPVVMITPPPSKGKEPARAWYGRPVWIFARPPDGLGVPGVKKAEPAAVPSVSIDILSSRKDSRALPSMRFFLDLFRGMFVAACAAFSFFLLVMTIHAMEHDGTITPVMIVLLALYLLLLTFWIYLPLGAFAGLAWPLVLAGRGHVGVVLRGAVLGLILAAVVQAPLACQWLTRPRPVGHKPPPPCQSLRELLAMELSLTSSCVAGYAGWAWLASRRLPGRREPKQGPPWPDV
jgi:hypothetical protein